MRKRNEASLKTAVTCFLKKKNFLNDEKFDSIKKNWNLIVGLDNAKHIRPYMLKDKILFVAIDSPEWGSYIRMENDGIKNIIKEELNVDIIMIKPRYISLNKAERIASKKVNTKVYRELTKKEILTIQKKAKNENQLFSLLFNAFLHKNREDN
jgi:hypothetical protein